MGHIGGTLPPFYLSSLTRNERI